MTHNKRPEPLFDATAGQGTTCPVCGFSSYSREGIHPQCAQQRADEKRVANLKSKKDRGVKTKSTASEELKPWHKRCPKCRTQVHIRRSSCHCGYNFSAEKTPGGQ